MIDWNEYAEEKYIAFVDVLGFSSLVNRFEYRKTFDSKFHYTSNDTFHVVNNYYYKLLRELWAENGSDLEITAISDCVIVSSKKLLPNLLMFLYYLQTDMFYYDAENVKILMRGYLTKGKFVHNHAQNLIVGEAYQRAVKGEKKTNYPRIEVDASIVDEIKNPYDLLITKDKYGKKYYLNYLLRDKLQYMCKRIDTKDFINENLQNCSQKILPKYKWLNKYYERIQEYNITTEDKEKWRIINPPKEWDL